MKTIKQQLIDSSLELNSISDTPRLDAELLLQHSLKRSRTYLFTYPEKILSHSEKLCFNELLSKRLTGLPIAYITGEKEFWSLKLEVSKDTLIPRADTEILVEAALNKLKNLQNPIIIELGTGSGAIAIALAKERPDATIYACDISKKALLIAQKNINTHNIKNINLIHSDWFKNIPKVQANLIISNPPYIARNSTALEKHVKNHEPASALFSNDNGYKDLLTIINQCTYYLRHEGYILLEHGIHQEQKLNNVLKRGTFQSIENHRDIQNINRCVSAQINNIKK